MRASFLLEGELEENEPLEDQRYIPEDGRDHSRIGSWCPEIHQKSDYSLRVENMSKQVPKTEYMTKAKNGVTTHRLFSLEIFKLKSQGV